MGRASPRKVHRYSLAFKRQAVKLSQLEGVEVQAVADDIFHAVGGGRMRDGS